MSSYICTGVATRLVHDKIQAAKGVSRMEIYEDVFHCWQMFDGVVPEARVALRRAAEFIRSHVSPAHGVSGLHSDRSRGRDTT